MVASPYHRRRAATPVPTMHTVTNTSPPPPPPPPPPNGPALPACRPRSSHPTRVLPPPVLHSSQVLNHYSSSLHVPPQPSPAPLVNTYLPRVRVTLFPTHQPAVRHPTRPSWPPPTSLPWPWRWAWPPPSWRPATPTSRSTIWWRAWWPQTSCSSSARAPSARRACCCWACWRTTCSGCSARQRCVCNRTSMWASLLHVSITDVGRLKHRYVCIAVRGAHRCLRIGVLWVCAGRRRWAREAHASMHAVLFCRLDCNSATSTAARLGGMDCRLGPQQHSIVSHVLLAHQLSQGPVPPSTSPPNSPLVPTLCSHALLPMCHR